MDPPGGVEPPPTGLEGPWSNPLTEGLFGLLLAARTLDTGSILGERAALRVWDTARTLDASSVLGQR